MSVVTVDLQVRAIMGFMSEISQNLEKFGKPMDEHRCSIDIVFGRISHGLPARAT